MSDTQRVMRNGRVVNVVFVGLGGQGVLKAADILAEVAVQAGFDVKKSELHGMSQRGGSVISDVRYGRRVFSPMVPLGEADFVVALASEEVDRNQPYLRPGGVLIGPEHIPQRLDIPVRSLNVALLGALSRYLDFSESLWREAIRAHLPEKVYEMNVAAFTAMRGVE